MTPDIISSEEIQWLDALPDGVKHAALPTPFAVGTINCWLLPGKPVTLIDPGMIFPGSAEAVQDLLAASGLVIEDIDQVIITHAHVDHMGAAAYYAERADVPILCSAAEKPKLLADPRNNAIYGRVLDELGVPQGIKVIIRQVVAEMGELIQDPKDDAIVTVEDGERIEAGGRVLTALVAPGHAVGHMCLWDGATLFSGDHLLPHITPNPILEVDLAKGQRCRSLIDYLDSLDRFADLAPAAVLPGHDKPFTDVPALVANIRRHHERRLVHVLDIVRELGEADAFRTSQEVFPELVGFMTMLGVSEIVGHLDVLEVDGRVHVDTDLIPHRYHPTA